MVTIPHEVIVVEGRDDTHRLIQTFGPHIKTIETNGSALTPNVMEQIKQAAKQFGVIIFTDPDYQGDRIRRLIAEQVPTAKHAHLSQSEAYGGKGKSLGLEHANPAAIKAALSQVLSPNIDLDLTMISLTKLRNLGLIGQPNSALLRQRVADAFHLGHLNGKQLQKKLAQYQINEAMIEQVLTERKYIE